MAPKSITYSKKALPMDFVPQCTRRRIPVAPGDKLTAGARVEFELPSGQVGGFELRAKEIEELACHPDFGGPNTPRMKPDADPVEVAKVEEKTAAAEGVEPQAEKAEEV